MNNRVTPLSINIQGGRYKSISSLTWDNVPGFAILTGKNGSGKTQLLELLAFHFSGGRPPGQDINTPLSINVIISGTAYDAADVAYVASTGRFSGGSHVSLANLEQLRQQAIQNAHRATQPHDIAHLVKSRRAILRSQSNEPTSEEDLLADDIDITAGLAQVFVAHRFKMLEALERGTPGVDENGNPLGVAPWTVVNEALEVSGFPYDVISPHENKILDAYVLRLRDRHSSAEINAVDLSSGEKVLLQLVLWLYAAGTKGRFPKLLLLDEPDAHLHPSMTNQFLNVISEVLVNRYGVRVIITTHSPSTVALAPENAVFQLERGNPSIIKIDHRPGIISVLTAGLVTVSRSTKFCFVEDKDDVAFYESVYAVLTDHGPNPDPMALNPAPSIVFIAASVGTGSTRIAGGSTIVTKWVEKLDANPLDSTFFGVIDRDVSNLAKPRIYVLGRYSFENYLLDPLTIYCLLIEEDKAPPITGFKISIGSEHVLREQPNHILQSIVDSITTSMVDAEPSLTSTGPLLVSYTANRQVNVPSWVINHRGHDLLPVAQRAFGGARIISPPRLNRALRRSRMLPKELATILAGIQRS